MIKIERTSVMNLENAMRGARNPLNSWARSDSAYDENGNYILGENDLSLESAEFDLEVNEVNAHLLEEADHEEQRFIRLEDHSQNHVPEFR